MLLHRLQQGALHLGGRAIDLVGQDEVGEDGPFAGRKGAGLGVVDLRANEICGQQVGSELDALKLGLNGVDIKVVDCNSFVYIPFVSLSLHQLLILPCLFLYLFCVFLYNH
jgi:hypothetical protein